MSASAEIPGLTPVRGLAALRVMTMHFTAYLLPAFGLAMSEASPVFSRAYLGVDYFFVLSGFILAHAYGDRFKSVIEAPVVRRFWWARFSRIWPLHIVALATLVVWQYGSRFAYSSFHGAPLPVESFDANMTRSSLLQNIFLLQIFFEGQHTSWNYPAWSLSAEWGSYLLMPFLFKPYFLIPRWAMPAGVLVAMLGLWGIERAFLGHLDVAGWPGFFRCLLDQFMGVLFYRLYREGFGASLLKRDAILVGLVAVVAGLMSFRSVPDAMIVPWVAVMVWVIASNRGRINQWLNCAGMRKLGELSYGIYIWHGVVHLVLYRMATLWLGAEAWRDAPVAIAIVTLAASYFFVLGLARLSLRYVENPARNWLRNEFPRLIRSRARRPAASALELRQK